MVNALEASSLRFDSFVTRQGSQYGTFAGSNPASPLYIYRARLEASLVNPLGGQGVPIQHSKHSR